MSRKTWLKILIWTFIFLCFGLKQYPLAADVKDVKTEHAIYVDIPVVLEKANVVFNMDHLAFAGDLPVGINYMHLLANRFKELGTKGQIIGIFHGDAAYMTLNDKTYNTYRNVNTGNPYKDLIAQLIKQGVQIEECAVSMKSHGWVNEDLLPRVKVNTRGSGSVNPTDPGRLRTTSAVKRREFQR